MTIVRGLTFERWAVLITVRHCEYVGIVCGCVAKQSHQKVSLLVQETASFLAVTVKRFVHTQKINVLLSV